MVGKTGSEPSTGKSATREFLGDGDMGRATRADARRNYERLVASARVVFAKEGAGASMEAIAKEAGVGVGTLYRHFPKRIDVVEAVYRDDVDVLVAKAASVEAYADPWAALVEWLAAFVRYATTKRTLLSELHEAFEKDPQLKLASRERIEAALGSAVRRAQRAGLVRGDVDGADVMQLLGSMCMSATLTEPQARRLMALVLDGLRPPGYVEVPRGQAQFTG
jgi:AcrR family transcriptional regulator